MNRLLLVRRKRPLPPSQRLRYVSMSRVEFTRLVAGWSAGLAALLLLCLSIRWLG